MRIIRDLLAHRFHKKRQMFFVIECQGVSRIIYPDVEYKNMTHIEWFKAIGIYDKFDDIIRGYFLDDSMVLYMGHKFDIPPIGRVMNIIDGMLFRERWRTHVIGLGAKRSWWRTLIGVPWACKATVRYTPMHWKMAERLKETYKNISI